MPRYIDAVNFGSRLRAVAERSLQKDYNHFIMEENKSETAGLLRAIEILNSQPTADVQEVKHGRWEDDLLGVKCSECGYSCSDPYYAGIYCQHCGAIMDRDDRSKTGGEIEENSTRDCR